MTGKEFMETYETKKRTRYVRARIPNTNYEIEFDTVTMELSYHEPLEQWENCINHEYYND